MNITDFGKKRVDEIVRTVWGALFLKY